MKIGTRQFRERFAEMIRRIKFGERVYVTRYGSIVAVLTTPDDLKEEEERTDEEQPDHG